MDRNNAFSALKGLAMCMIMAGHLHIANWNWDWIREN